MKLKMYVQVSAVARTYYTAFGNINIILHVGKKVIIVAEELTAESSRATKSIDLARE